MINEINPIVDIITNSDGIIILAGAGMGVDAGIPDFRGNTGLWTSEKDNFIKFASGNAFHERPLEAWNFYINRLMNYSKLPPHRGYFDLKNLMEKLNKDIFVVTSNVDGHFKKSGYNKDKIYEIHGNLEYIQCSNFCCRETPQMPLFEKSLNSLNEAPHCNNCGSVMRPLVMMFNDPWFYPKFTGIQSISYMDWASTKNNIVGIEIGAGLAVPSIRHFGQDYTKYLIRINPNDYNISRKQDISIKATALEGIDLILKCFNQNNENK